MKSKKAFTLIEILIVITIIAILTSIVLVGANLVRKKARDVQRIVDTNQIDKAITLYLLDHDDTPPGDDGVEYINGNPNWIPGLVPNYMPAVPLDPLDTGPYKYHYMRQGKNYEVAAFMEQHGNDPPCNDNGSAGCEYYEKAGGNFLTVYNPGASGWNFTSGGGGGCIPDWQCGQWSTCADSTQTRTCTDANNCGTSEGKPSESQSCNISCTPEGWTSGSWLGYTYKCTAACGADADCVGQPSVISFGPEYNNFACDANKKRALSSPFYSYCICNENCKVTFIEDYCGCENGAACNTCLTQCGSDSVCSFNKSGAYAYKCDGNKLYNSSGNYYCLCDLNCTANFRHEYGCQNGASVLLGSDTVRSPTFGRKICLTQCGANPNCHGSDPGGRNYRCNADGVYNASGSYLCSCGSDCQVKIGPY